MGVEDVGQLPQIDDAADPWHLLAAALRSAEVSRRRANDASTKAGRWRDARDEFVAAARAALGMGPPTPHFVHTGPIVERIREVVAERDRALAELEAAGADLALSERRRADATKGANATAATLESLRATLRKERRSIAAREGAVERRVRAVERAAEERVARASAAVTAAREEAQQQAAWTEAQLGALQAELEAARAGGAVAEAKAEAKAELRRAQLEAAQQVAAAQEQARAAKEEARAAREALREARRSVKAESRSAAPAAVAPRQALIDLLRTGPASITRHRARLEKWAETGSGPALEAARSMAAALEGGEVTGSARMAAMTGLAGLLGGV